MSPKPDFNPSGPDVFFLHQGLRGVKIHPPLKIDLFLKKNMFYHHEVNFCINSALFWCIALVFSSILANFSNFIEKSAKFGTFKKMSHIQVIYINRELKWFRNWFQGKWIWFTPKNYEKTRISWILTQKSVKLNIFE